MFEGLITERVPTEKRTKGLDGTVERRLSEGAVILAYGMHLLRTEPGVDRVELHPDGEHGKRFDMRAWLEAQGFRLVKATGKTAYGGEYRSEAGQVVVLHPAPGLGDVVAHGTAGTVIAECKGGAVNTRHSGQTSKLSQGFRETIGQLMAKEITPGGRQVAVVPRTAVTEKLAKRTAPRARLAGICIALVDEVGNVFDVEG